MAEQEAVFYVVYSTWNQGAKRHIVENLPHSHRFSTLMQCGAQVDYPSLITPYTWAQLEAQSVPFCGLCLQYARDYQATPESAQALTDKEKALRKIPFCVELCLTRLIEDPGVDAEQLAQVRINLTLELTDLVEEVYRARTTLP